MEIDLSRGSQYRRVLIRNPREEQLFKENVNLSDWTEGSEPPALAGTPVS
ncbi:MAG TPA: hypothetical protein VF783_09045 [Terriglobales bacterium]